jgi:hypothetical protein
MLSLGTTGILSEDVVEGVLGRLQNSRGIRLVGAQSESGDPFVRSESNEKLRRIFLGVSRVTKVFLMLTEIGAQHMDIVDIMRE